MTSATDKVWSFGPFVLNEISSELGKGGEAVPIEPQSLRLLGYLINHRNRVASRDNLIDEIWHGRIVSDWAISGAIKALRHALDELGTECARSILVGFVLCQRSCPRGPGRKPERSPRS